MTDWQLPEDWKWVKIGDLCETTSGGTPSRRNAEYFQGDIPWVKSGELPDGFVENVEELITNEAIQNSSAKLFPQGTLLIAMYGATVGKLGILSMDAATNQAVCAIFQPDNIERDYLFWYLRAIRNQLIGISFGGAQPNISQTVIRNTVFPLPYPNEPERSLDVQRRIVARIEALLAEVREMRKLHGEITADADALMNAVLAEVFENLKCSYEAMMDCCAILGGGTLPAPEPEESLHDGVLLLKVSELNREENIPVITTSTHMISMQTAEKRNLRVISPGSIIIPKRGGAIATNKKRLLSRKAILDPNLMAITPNNSQLKPKFLYYWFEKLNLSTISSGSTVPQINRKDLAPLEIPILSEDKQLTIVTYLDHIHTEIYEMQKNLADEKPMLKVVEQAILSQAFRGEL